MLQGSLSHRDYSMMNDRLLEANNNNNSSVKITFKNERIPIKSKLSKIISRPST